MLDQPAKHGGFKLGPGLAFKAHRGSFQDLRPRYKWASMSTTE
jgi:hypothetical protein